MVTEFLEASGCNFHFLDFVVCNISKNLMGERFLEIGCGTGVFAQALSAATGLTAYGTEISERASKIASTRIQCQCVVDLKLPFPNNYFDLVVAKDVIPMIERKDIWFSEIHRVLRLGGNFISYVPQSQDFFEKPLYNFIDGSKKASVNAYADAEEILLEMEKAGFSNEIQRVHLGTVEINFDYVNKHNCGFFNNTNLSEFENSRIEGMNKLRTGINELAILGLRTFYEWERLGIIGLKK